MNNNYINELDCEIVQDIIPLYHDKAVSDKTKISVENHLRSCESCKAEYGLYLKELPKCESKSTVQEYISMMRKKRIKQMLTVIVAVVLSAVVFRGGQYLLCEAPLVINDDMQVQQVYRYENNGKMNFFYIYSDPTLKRGSAKGKYYEKDGKKIFELNERNPVFSRVHENFRIGTSSLTVVDSSAKGDARFPDDIDVLYLNGKEVWSKEKNGNDKVPEYITKGWVDYENGNNDEFGDSDWIDFHSFDDYIEVEYHAEKRIIRWSYDGERIYDSRESNEKEKN